MWEQSDAESRSSAWLLPGKPDGALAALVGLGLDVYGSAQRRSGDRFERGFGDRNPDRGVTSRGRSRRFGRAARLRWPAASSRRTSSVIGRTLSEPKSEYSPSRAFRAMSRRPRFFSSRISSCLAFIGLRGRPCPPAGPSGAGAFCRRSRGPLKSRLPARRRKEIETADRSPQVWRSWRESAASSRTTPALPLSAVRRHEVRAHHAIAPRLPRSLAFDLRTDAKRGRTLSLPSHSLPAARERRRPARPERKVPRWKWGPSQQRRR